MEQKSSSRNYNRIKSRDIYCLLVPKGLKTQDLISILVHSLSTCTFTGLVFFIVPDGFIYSFNRS